MKSGRLIIPLLLGILFLTACSFMGPTKEALNQPPCGSSAQRQKSSECPAIDPQSPILTVSLCDIVRHPDTYKGKLVRVHATFYSDAGDHSLKDLACSTDRNLEHTGFSADFAESYGIHPDAKKTIDEFLCAASHYYWNKQIDMVAVGKLSEWHGRLWFFISCVEQAAPIAPTPKP